MTEQTIIHYKRQAIILLLGMVAFFGLISTIQKTTEQDFLFYFALNTILIITPCSFAIYWLRSVIYYNIADSIFVDDKEREIKLPKLLTFFKKPHLYVVYQRLTIDHINIMEIRNNPEKLTINVVDKNNIKVNYKIKNNYISGFRITYDSLKDYLKADKVIITSKTPCILNVIIN